MKIVRLHLHNNYEFNQWVQRTVLLRDRGKCAICQADLSGLMTTDFEKALDHIVSLALGGNNDVTNLQLLCQACNLKKLDHTINTSERYPTYFSLEED